MDDYFDEWGGIDWGSTPNVDTSGFDWSNVDFGMGDLYSGAIDLGDLKDFGFDLSGVEEYSPGLPGDLAVWGADVGYQWDYPTLESLSDAFGTAQDDAYRTGMAGYGGTGGGTSGGGTSGGGGGSGAPSGDSKTKSILDAINQATGGKQNTALLAALLGGLMGLLGKGSTNKGPVGYQGGIPKYTATRVPGRGVEYTRAAQGGLMGMAEGGETRPARYLRGGTDGMADKIQTDIDGKQPARLSHGEFVVSADVVSALGSGNSDAGADVLYDMMDRVRKNAYGRKKQITPVNKRKVLPA